jgi:hypothetical protein
MELQSIAIIISWYICRAIIYQQPINVCTYILGTCTQHLTTLNALGQCYDNYLWRFLPLSKKTNVVIIFCESIAIFDTTLPIV